MVAHQDEALTRVFRFTIAGAVGAIIAWAVMEPTSLMPDVYVRLGDTERFFIGLISGLGIGLALGVADGLSGLAPKDIRKRILLGAAFGAAGGILGLAFGNAFYSMMERIAGPGPYAQRLPGNVPAEAQLPSESTPSFLCFLLLLFGRAIGWAFIGGFIGLSQGIATNNTRKMVNGLVGGILGGGIAGGFMEIIAWMNHGGIMNFAPWAARLTDYTLTGGAIGFFIGFIEEARKQAWLIRLVGRNEGKEYSLYKRVTVIGRSEEADIPVFDDPDVSERHTAISAQGQRYFIEDLGSFYGTTLNGNKVSSREPLRDGDVLEAGKTRFTFRDKITARYRSGATHDTGLHIPTGQHVCPFCGGVKDASGACECTIAAGAQPGSQTAKQTAVQQALDMSQTAPMAAAPAPAAQGPRLVAMSGPYAGQTYPLKPGQTEIGREATKDVGMPMDNTVSRNHAHIAQEGAGYVIYDDGSTNGTYVNGARIQRKELANTDVIQIGSTRLKVEL